MLIAGAAEGESTLENVLDSADAHSCIAALTTLGVIVEETGRTETGISLRILPPAGGMLAQHSTNTAEPAAARIDVGNSGTTLFLMTAMAAIRPGGICFDGDASIRGRSAAPLLAALTALGASVTENGTSGCAPYCVSGPLAPSPDGAGAAITIESPTSQYLSALLLAAPLLDSGTLTINVALLNEHPYVDLTCWWLEQQQITCHREGYKSFTIPGGQHYHPVTTTLPGDWSSATFWFVAAAITGTPVTVHGLAADDVQGDRGVLEILTTLGCTVSWSDGLSLTISGRPLRGGSFDLNAMPDALPALAVLACYAPEPVALINVPQAREKETDRIAVMAQELAKLGGAVRELPDGLEIEPRVLQRGTVHSHADHRIAMALAVAALAAAGPVTIEDAGAAAVTYPAFFQHLRQAAPDSRVEVER